MSAVQPDPSSIEAAWHEQVEYLTDYLLEQYEVNPSEIEQALKNPEHRWSSGAKIASLEGWVWKG